MHSRPNWLEKYRIRRISSNRRNRKVTYVDHTNNKAEATHYNMEGGTYHVPRSQEKIFLKNYIDYIFGERNGSLSLTEAPLTTDLGVVYSPVFIDFNLKYPLGCDGE